MGHFARLSRDYRARTLYLENLISEKYGMTPEDLKCREQDIRLVELEIEYEKRTVTSMKQQLKRKQRFVKQRIDGLARLRVRQSLSRGPSSAGSPSRSEKTSEDSSD